MHVVGGAGARVVGLGERVGHQPRRRPPEVGERAAERRGVGNHGGIAGLLLHETVDLREERRHPARAVLGELATNEVERLDAVGALVDHGDAGIAHELRHAPPLDVAVAAEHLLRRHGVVEGAVGQHTLQDGCEQAEPIVGRLHRRGIVRAVGEIALQRGPHDERARRLVEGANLQEGATHVGVDDDRLGTASRWRAQRPALPAVLGVGGGVLVGDLADRQPLDGDAQSGLVHHHEHGGQAAIGLADQPAGRAVVVHDAGGVGADAHLVFQRAAAERVARTERPVRFRQHFGHDEHRDTLVAGRRAFDPGEHEVDDVLRQVMLAGGYEDLLAGEGVGPVGARHGLRPHQAEVRAAVGLGEVHRRRPAARDEARGVHVLLGVGAEAQDGGERAAAEGRDHGQRHVGRRREFEDGHHQRERQPLAAIFAGHRQAEPTALRVGVVGRLEPGRGRHRTVGRQVAAEAVANEVQGLEHILAERGGTLEHRRDHVGRRVGKAAQVRVAPDLEHVLKEEPGFGDRSLVERHGTNLRAGFTPGRHTAGGRLPQAEAEPGPNASGTRLFTPLAAGRLSRRVPSSAGRRDPVRRWRLLSRRAAARDGRSGRRSAPGQG